MTMTLRPSRVPMRPFHMSAGSARDDPAPRVGVTSTRTAGDATPEVHPTLDPDG